jgi:hypothetical protein
MTLSRAISTMANSNSVATLNMMLAAIRVDVVGGAKICIGSIKAAIAGAKSLYHVSKRPPRSMKWVGGINHMLS